MRIIEIAFSGYPVTDMARARSFYEGVLKLAPSCVGEGEHWIEYEISGGIFAISNIAPDWKPSSDGPSVAFEVEDFDEAIRSLEAQKVAFAMRPFETPVCRMAVVLDPDGNSITIHKRHPGRE